MSNDYNLTQSPNSHGNGRGFKRPENISAKYSGHMQTEYDDIHELDRPLTLHKIIGYSGFIPNRASKMGRVVTKDEDEVKPVEKIITKDFTTTFRTIAKNMDLHERYNTAIEQLEARGQNQSMLLKIVQARLSQRVSSYAEQKIQIRLLFEAFDFNGDGVLDEGEFRECLEKMTIQFDDVQALALFAYFDIERDGTIEWREFAEKSMVPNPKGGTAVLPKQITATLKNGNWAEEARGSAKILM